MFPDALSTDTRKNRRLWKLKIGDPGLPPDDCPFSLHFQHHSFDSNREAYIIGVVEFTIGKNVLMKTAVEQSDFSSST